jgi:hypothetical protein
VNNLKIKTNLNLQSKNTLHAIIAYHFSARFWCILNKLITQILHDTKRACVTFKKIDLYKNEIPIYFNPWIIGIMRVRVHVCV